MSLRRVAVTLLSGLAACAPATVDTVQPNAVAKSALEGEWYWRNTVVQVPYGTAATFTGAQGELERVRFRVEEDWLLVYRSYENVLDSDLPTGTAVSADGTFQGAPIAAFPIESHFDIRRSYDRATGEEGNVVEENTERPWYERDYVRVDWSGDAASSTLELAGVDVAVAHLYSEDPSDTWAPRFDDSDADGSIDAINLYQRLIAEPSTTRIPGYGDIPTCYFYGQAEYECAASEIVVNTSLMRVDDKREYAGFEYSDRYMDTFGFFETMRLEYDRDYGLTEAGRHWMVNRHNLWGEWFEKDAGGRILCKTKDRTDLCTTFTTAEGAKPVELPYRDRPVRPIVYHATADMDPRLVDTFDTIAAEWNRPFRDTINGLRFWECMDEDGDAASCEAAKDPELQVFVLCPHNPSLPDDPDLCSTDHTGPQGRPDGIPDEARIGDLRYNFVALLRNPQITSPFGYGPSAADPLGPRIATADGGILMGAGEIISANAFVYEHVLDRVATSTTDLVQLINGEISEEDFIEGENVEAWVRALREGDPTRVAGRVADRPDATTPWTEADVQDVLARMDTSWSSPLHTALSSTPRPTHPSEVEPWMDHVTSVLDSSGLFRAGAAAGVVAWEDLLASPYDDLLWNEEAVASYGFDPVAQLQGDASPLQGRSPLDLIAPSAFAEREYGRTLAGQHAVDLDEAGLSDPALLGLATRYAGTDLSWEAIQEEIRDETFVSVMLHEIGHTVGLRHNFAGSTDAWNYHPDYWTLRQDGDMGPRHIDPETPNEVEGGIRELQYSSVMDYAGSRNGDWHGLGHWDRAAVKFGYGELVEVMSELPGSPAIDGLPNDIAVGYVAYFNTSNVFPAPVLEYTAGGFLAMHYTDYPAIAGDLEARIDVPRRRLAPSMPDTDDKDYGFDDMLVLDRAVPGLLEAGAPAAPYRFCSDEFAIGMMCARFDEGADPYEIQDYYITRYWDGYLQNNFKRGRYGFGSSEAYLDSLYERTFAPLAVFQRYYALFHTIFEAGTDPEAAAFFADPKGFGGWTAGVDRNFQLLFQVIVRPEPGEYAATWRPDGTRIATSSYGVTPDVEVPLGPGAWYESDWEYEDGYHWFDKQSRVGTYWDKMLALEVLTTTSPYGFVGYDTTADPRAYALGYQSLWRDPLSLFLGRLTADEAPLYAPIVEPDGTLTWPDVADMGSAWPPPGREDDAVQPAAWWLVQYGAGMMGKALLQEGYDVSFLDRSRVALAGGGDDVDAPPGVEEVRFTDPGSGKTWVAWSYPATRPDGSPLLDDRGDPVELGPAARLLRRANVLSDYCTLTEVAPYTDPADPASVESQRQVACDTLAQVAADIQLQARLHDHFASIGL